jgi:hypothetical protein
MLWRYTQRETKTLLLATLLVFSAGGLLLADSWQEVRTRALTANTVGVLAEVPENQVNTYLAELNERERLLAARESALIGGAVPTSDTTLTVVSLAWGFLLALILMNFYLDHKRRLLLG